MTEILSITDKQTSRDCERSLFPLIRQKSLYHFVKTFWSIINSTTFVDEWYIQAICEHLEAVKKRDIKKLVINIPPGVGKSMLCSVYFPVWCWLTQPNLKFLTGANSETLAIRDTTRSRTLIQHPDITKYWGDKIRLLTDENQKKYYKNVSKGERHIFTTAGKITGWRADHIIVDDPMDKSDAESKTKTARINDVVFDSLMTRLDPNATLTIVMQRLSVNDCTGYALKREGWEYLCLPLEYDLDLKCKTSIFVDPRKKEGEVLTSRKDPVQIKKDLYKEGAALHSYDTQYQQHPSIKEGGIIKISYIKFYEGEPKGEKLFSCWAWDTASKKGERNDYCVGVYIIATTKGYFLDRLWRKKVFFPKLKKTVKDLYEEYPTDAIYIEDKSSGQQLVQALNDSSNYLPVIAVMPGKDIPSSKEARLDSISTRFEAEKVFLKKGDWNREVILELIQFPKAKHDDIVDAISLGMCKMIKFNSSQPRFRIL